MNLLQERSLSWVVVFLSGLFGISSGFVALAGRSGLYLHGCNEITPDEWASSAQYGDAYSTATGVSWETCALLVIASLCVWRLLHD
ncbi:MAG: hypothetical protein ACK47C_00470 [Paracoccaceae bacterium]|jgi:hypothetical protein